MSDQVTLSVLIVSFNSEPWLPECLGSVTEELRHVAGEVVVVDNASTDGSVALIEAGFPDVRLVRSAVNLGFARAVNLAAANARGEWLLLLNPDTVVSEGAIRELLRFAGDHPGNRMYGGRIVTPDGELDPASCWALPTLWSMLCFATGLSTVGSGSRILDPESLGDWQRDTVREVDMITGALLLIAASDWRLLGGLDEAYFVYGEDADLAFRARKQGIRPIIDPAAQIVHHKSVSTPDKTSKYVLLLAGKATYLSKNWNGPKSATGLFLLRAGVWLRATLERGRPRGWRGAWTQRSRWTGGFPAALFPESDR
jgi:N-acetylglucosaminyl-diphospho-decaprenol L-rhamnosyltransferase